MLLKRHKNLLSLRLHSSNQNVVRDDCNILCRGGKFNFIKHHEVALRSDRNLTTIIDDTKLLRSRPNDTSYHCRRTSFIIAAIGTLVENDIALVLHTLICFSDNWLIITHLRPDSFVDSPRSVLVGKILLKHYVLEHLFYLCRTTKYQSTMSIIDGQYLSRVHSDCYLGKFIALRH